ncbi:ribonucleotide reductase subunit [Bubaline alphaherpesvirus 1]|uniref:Ribonucleoside-diphosphate reductase large subunit n=1 Tax=Bubaline alphaherpesvirus 1 TaxID=202910 RepID=A0A1L5JKF4_9ALPH|nr:ribonucleotide reductase subunit [Bubaline alphaherpesvirus 1]APO15876.1 ribonucleotide reductase subunit [Bubaline alphaherpesvirus 1]WPD94478.1 UL39 [Bubaline alphaherpesvirus 1]
MASGGASETTNDAFMRTACPADAAEQLEAEHAGWAQLGCGAVPPPPAAASRPSRAAVAAYVGEVVDRMKAQSRVDERVYVKCGQLVHLRVRARGVPLDAWLASAELALVPEVAERVRANRAFVEVSLRYFELTEYAALCALGLQSALKYEEMYLAKLEGGALESMGQFFARIAATAATWTMREPAFGRALVGEGATWCAVFNAYLTALYRQLVVPATPIMLFAGRARGSLASCYLLNPRVTSSTEAVEAITTEVARILLNRGGIGISFQSFNRPASRDCKRGIMGALKLLDSMAMAINSDSERPTGICVYVEPWHCDVRAVLNMRGLLARDESTRCDNLFSCLWVPDLLFDRYLAYLEGREGVVWTLFDDRASHLSRLHGPAFAAEYERLEREGLGVEAVPVQDLAFLVVRSIVMTGSPFVMFKDACNRHYHMDTAGDALTGSNLCTEIVQRADPDAHGVCNLASVNLPRCVREAEGGALAFDFAALSTAAATAAIFVNAMMLGGQYPTERAARGVARHRSLGIGFQGLHTLLLELGMDMLSPAARRLNVEIAERLLLAVMATSATLCEYGCAPFEDFARSKFARGLMPFDGYEGVVLSLPRAWARLREKVARHGLYNAQFVALMPTVSSSQVTEGSEGFSPVFTNMFSKVTMSGELLRPNLPLMRALRKHFTREASRLGAVRALDREQWSVAAALGDLAPGHPLAKFKTAFEYDQERLIDLCADRAPFVDQSQSMSLFVTEPMDGKVPASQIMNLLVYAYKKGLKTGLYYCKIRKATNNGVFTGGDLVCSGCHL